MKRVSQIILMAALLLGLVAAAWSADVMVSVYVNGKKVAMEPSARVRDGVTYGPLRASAQAVGAHVDWNAKTRTATVCTEDRCAPIKQSQGIMVGNSIMIPVRLMSQALGRKVTWDGAAQAVRIQ